MYVKVTTRGLDEVADGRTFIIEEGMSLDPPEFDLATPVGLVEPVSPESPMSCSSCGKPLERVLLSHNYVWMYTLFGCTDHPRVAVYLDIFPKVTGGTTHDWTNSFMGMDTGQERLIGIVEDMTWPEERLADYLNQARSEAQLTSEGLKFDRTPRLLRRLLARR